MLGHLDERHVETEHAERGCDLGADEASADDERLARIGRLRDDRRRVGERSERVHGRQVGARHGERARTGTARDDERPVRQRLARREAHRVRIRVHRGDRGLEPELDDLILVLLGRVDERLGRLHLAAQDPLREWRPVVGRVLVRREDRDRRLPARLAVGVDDARGRAAASDDHDRIRRHRVGLPRRGGGHTSAVVNTLWRPVLPRLTYCSGPAPSSTVGSLCNPEQRPPPRRAARRA